MTAQHSGNLWTLGTPLENPIWVSS